MTCVLFRVDCAACGPVTLASDDLEFVCGAGVGYRFVCPVCETTSHHLADELTEAILLAAGIRVSDAGWPSEVEESHCGPVVSEAEIAEFVGALDQPVTTDK